MRTDDDETERPTIDEGQRSASTAPPSSAERYRIGERIGRGGMGEILAARDERLGREVAIKRLRAAEPTALQTTRFLHEARIQGRLDHPAIAPVHDLGFDERGRPYFAMKKLAGTTLSAILKAREAPRRRLLRAFVDVSLAVEFAHVRGVIHRDLKPDNVMLGDFGEVYVLDWGVAKVASESESFDDLATDGLETIAGAVIGTPAFMSPEQARDSADVDERTDVFALGKVLAAILAVEGDPPPELVALAALATARDRDQRVASARELGDEVQRYLDGDRDLELRQKLAREQLEQARAAFAAGLDDGDRGIAIRAASSAMALDPTLGGAAELVGRLMLEPPRTLPPEVAREMFDDDARQARAHHRGGLWASLIGLAVMVPSLLAMGEPTGALLTGGLVAVNALLHMRSSRDAQFPSTWLLVFTNALIVALLAHVFSPMIVAPGVAAIAAMMLAANPFIERAGAVVLLGLALEAAIVLPAIAERAGLLPATMELHPEGLLIHPTAPLPPWSLLPIVVVYGAGMIAAALTLGRLARTHNRRSVRQLHLQAWQLRQLVADPLAAR